jgi:hypothetical protein
VFGEVVVLKHPVLVAYIGFGFPRESLLHTAIVYYMFSGQSLLCHARPVAYILTEPRTWILYTRAQRSVLTRSQEVGIGLLVEDFCDHRELACVFAHLACFVYYLFIGRLLLWYWLVYVELVGFARDLLLGQPYNVVEVPSQVEVKNHDRDYNTHYLLDARRTIG